LVVCLAGRGERVPATGLDCCWLCILALRGRVAGPELPPWRRRGLSRCRMSLVVVLEEAARAMTEEQRRVRLPCPQPNTVPPKRAGLHPPLLTHTVTCRNSL
jgi:hypothetical protein